MKSSFLILAGACSYGLLSTFVKNAFASGLHVGDVVGSQALFGVMILWLLVAVFVKSAKPSEPRRTLNVSVRQAIKLMAVGTTTGMTSMFYYAALQYISASFAIILLFQFTWIGIVFEAVAERKLPGKAKLYSLVLLVAGILMASGYVGRGHGSVSLSWNGLVLGLLSAITYALFIWFSGRTATQVAPITRSAFMLTGSFLLIMLVFPPHFLINGALQHSLLAWGLLLALFGTVIPPLCYASGVPRIGGGLATILSAAELPTAVMMSYLALNESVTAMQWGGVIITIAGIALPEMIKRGWTRTENG